MKNVVHLSDLSWRVARSPGDWLVRKGSWVINDSWNPGDYCMGFNTEAEARAEADYRNNPPPLAADERSDPTRDIIDDDIPF